MCIKKWEFEFELSPANTMGLIPVNFGEAERAVYQTDARDSLACAICLARTAGADVPALVLRSHWQLFLWR